MHYSSCAYHTLPLYLSEFCHFRVWGLCDTTMEEQKGRHKPHRQKHSGPQAERKKNKTKVQEEQSAKQRNPKAFAVQSVNKTARAVRRFDKISQFVNKFFLTFQKFLWI